MWHVDVAFCAPEQLARGEVSHASDAFAFGVCLYEIASGDVPHAGVPEPQVIGATLRGKRVPLDSVARQHRALADICRSCFAANAAQRPKMLDVALSLQNVADEVAAAL